MKLKDVTNVQLSQLLCDDDISTRDQMTHLCQSTHHYQNCVTIVESEKISDEIHEQILSGTLRDRQESKNLKRSMASGFEALARMTVSAKSIDILAHF